MDILLLLIPWCDESESWSIWSVPGTWSELLLTIGSPRPLPIGGRNTSVFPLCQETNNKACCNQIFLYFAALKVCVLS
jgi:hypothetical protein